MRGGVRVGAGRKTKESTTVIRIPNAILSQVKILIENHKQSLSVKIKLAPVLFSLSDSIEFERRLRSFDAISSHYRSLISCVFKSTYRAARLGCEISPSGKLLLHDTCPAKYFEHWNRINT
jgi:hypothetical protein